MGIVLTDSIWCEAGEHFWDREPTRGRVPKSCPEHKAQAKPSRREIKHRNREQEIERVTATIESLRERVARAEIEDDRTYAQMSSNDDDSFNLWLRSNIRMLNEITALRANEAKLERLQTERSQIMLDDEDDDTLEMEGADDDEEIEDEILAEFEGNEEAA